MSSRGTNSRQQSIKSTEAIQRPPETPLTSLVSSRAQSLASLIAEPPKDASSTNHLPTLLDYLRTPYPPKQNEYNFHNLLGPDKPTRPSKTTMKDGSSRFAQYLRDPLCQQPRQYAFPTFSTRCNTQDTFDWKHPGCRSWVRELWLQEDSGKGKRHCRRSNIFEQKKLWRFSGEEALHYRSDHISDNRILVQGVLNEGEEGDESSQLLARIENETCQRPEEFARAESCQRNQKAGSIHVAETMTNCDPRVNATLEYVSVALENYQRTRRASSTQQNTDNSPPPRNWRHWTDAQTRPFPGCWRRELLRDPSLRVSRALNVDHTGPRSAFREQGLVGQPPTGLHLPPIDIPRDTSSYYAVDVSRLRYQGRDVQFTDTSAPSPKTLTNVAVGTRSLHEPSPKLQYGCQEQSTSTFIPPPIGSHGRSLTARVGAHLPRTHERFIGPSTTSFTPPLVTVNRGLGSNHAAQPARMRYGSHPGQTDFNLRPATRPSTNPISAVPIPVPGAHTLTDGYCTGTVVTIPSQSIRAGATPGHSRRRRASSRASFLTNPSVEEADSGDFATQREEVLRSLINARRPGYMANV